LERETSFERAAFRSRPLGETCFINLDCNYEVETWSGKRASNGRRSDRDPLGELVFLNWIVIMRWKLGAGNEIRTGGVPIVTPWGSYFLNWIVIMRWKLGAGNEIRTRDPNLGKVVLYH
jgi:hypothetical protein